MRNLPPDVTRVHVLDDVGGVVHHRNEGNEDLVKCIETFKLSASVHRIDQCVMQGSWESLTMVKIPESLSSLRSIGNSVFVLCSNLLEIKNLSAARQLSEIQDYVFAGCMCLQSINLSNVISLTGILDCTNASSKSLKVIQFPPLSLLTEIQRSAFHFCESLTNQELPESVESIELSAF